MAATPARRIATRSALLTRQARERLHRTTPRGVDAFVAGNAMSQQQRDEAKRQSQTMNAGRARIVMGQVMAGAFRPKPVATPLP